MKTFLQTRRILRKNLITAALVAVMLVCAGNVWGQVTEATKVSTLTKHTYTNTSASGTTFVVPAGVTEICLETWGAGGGGGRARDWGQTAGGGGGGAYAKSIITVNEGDVLTVYIGAGGSGSSSGASSGGDTYIKKGNESLVLAKGGSGVEDNTHKGGNGGAASASIGDVKYDGGNGGTANGNGGTGNISGGGGGGAGSTGNGNPGGNGKSNGNNDAAGGETKQEHGGKGGVGKGAAGDGGNGSNYGGGGGGGKRGSASMSNKNGGNGAPGFARISFPTPPTIILSGSNIVCEGTPTTLTATSLHTVRSGDAGDGWEWLLDGTGSGPYTSTASYLTPITLPTGEHSYKVRVHYANVTWNGTTYDWLYDDSENEVKFTVIPKPKITNQQEPYYVCNGTNSITLTSSSLYGTINPLTEVTYTWVNNNPEIITLTDGSGASLPSFTATNTGTSPVTATITITPSRVTSGVTCTGDPFTLTIVVNPKPVTSDLSSFTECNGVVVNAINLTSVGFSENTGTDYNIRYSWTVDKSIGLPMTGSNVVAIPTFTATNDTNAPITAKVTVTPTYTNTSVSNGGSCLGTSKSFTITVNPTPEIKLKDATQYPKTFCNGNTITVEFEDEDVSGINYTWSVTNGANIGQGNLSSLGKQLSFTANIGAATAPVRADFSVTYEYTSGGKNCIPETTKTFSITVNPTPTMTNISGNSKTVCSGASPLAADIDFGGNVPGGTFKLEVTKGTGISLSPDIQSSSDATKIPQFTVTNSANTQSTVTFKVTPMYGSCEGTPSEFTITVNPVPTVVVTAPTAVCNDVEVNVSFTGDVAGTTYAWSWTGDDIGQLQSPGTGGFTFTSTNGEEEPLTADFTVTTSYDGCPGASKNFSITVNPSPIITQLSDINACTGYSTGDIIFESNLSGTTYTWTNTDPQIGLAASGSGNIPSFVPSTAGNSTRTATITVTPSTNGCSGTPMSFSITAIATPGTPLANSPQIFCSTDNMTFAHLGAYVIKDTDTELIWYNSPSGGTRFEQTAPVSTGIYYVAQGIRYGTGENDICESVGRRAIDVRLLAGPKVTKTATVCQGDNTQHSLQADFTGCAEVESNYSAIFSGLVEIDNRDFNKNPSVLLELDDELPDDAIITSVKLYISMTARFANDILLGELKSYLDDIRVKVTSPNNLPGNISETRPSGSHNPGSVDDLLFYTYANPNNPEIDFDPFGEWKFEFSDTDGDSYWQLDPDAYIHAVRVEVNYTILPSLEWYTEPQGGSKIFTGDRFDPVAEGHVNVDIPGEYKFYVGCSSGGCRSEATYTVIATPTIEPSANIICERMETATILHNTKVKGIPTMPAGYKIKWDTDSPFTDIDTYTSNGLSATSITLENLPVVPIGTYGGTLQVILSEGCESAPVHFDLIVSDNALTCNIESEDADFDNIACPDSEYTFYGPEGMATYQWSISGGSGGTIVNNESTNRSVVVKTAKNCNSSFTLTLTIASSPAPDACTSTCSENIQVKTTPFDMPLNESKVVNCFSEITPPTGPKNGQPVDGCGNLLTKGTTTYQDIKVVGPEEGDLCYEFVTSRIYTIQYTDCTGQSYNWTYTYLIDQTAPLIVSPVLRSKNIECVTEAKPLAAKDLPVVKTICGMVLDPINSEPEPEENLGPQSCSGNIKYRYTYKDCFNNQEVWTFTYNIDRTNSTAPVVPADETGFEVECADLAQAPTTLPDIKDFCGNPILPTAEPKDIDVDNGEVRFVYTYTDCAGKSSTWTYTVPVKDQTPPTYTGTMNPLTACGKGDELNLPSEYGTVAELVAQGVAISDNCGNENFSIKLPINDIKPSTPYDYPVTVTREYTVTDSTGNELIIPQIIIVNEIPEIDGAIVIDVERCAGEAGAIDFTPTDSDIKYKWEILDDSNKAKAASIGIAAPFNGFNTIPSFTAVNTGTTATDPVIVTVTPVSYDGNEVLCTGTPKPFSIVINPLPGLTIDPIDDFCQNSGTTSIALGYTTNVPASEVIEYEITWTQGGLTPTSGFETIPNDGIVIGLPQPLVVGEYVGELSVKTTKGCVSAQPIEFEILDIPVLSDVEIAPACQNATSTTLNFTATNSPTRYEVSWVSNVLTDVTGAINGNQIEIAIPSGIAVEEAGYSGTLVVYSGDCPSESKSFTLFINPTPVINTVTLSAYCAGDGVDVDLEETMSITNEDTDRGYSWSWKVPATEESRATSAGLSFTSDVANTTGKVEFTATNTGITPITFYIMVTPTLEAGTNPEEIACVGEAQQLVFTVNPAPIILDNPAPAISPLCVTAADKEVTLTFATKNNVSLKGFGVIWETGPGSSDISGWESALFLEQSEYLSPISVTIDLADCAPAGYVFGLGTYTGTLAVINEYDCTSKVAISFEVTEAPEITGVPTVPAICESSSAQYASMTFESTSILSTYRIEWTTAGFPAEPQTGNIVLVGTEEYKISDIAIPAGLGAGEYEGELFVIGGCESEAIEFSLVINPTPVIENDEQVTKCAGEEVSIVFGTGSDVDKTYVMPVKDPEDDRTYTWRWKVDNSANASAAGYAGASEGTNSIPTFTAANTGNTPISFTVTVTPVMDAIGGNKIECTGLSKTLTITVDPTPTITDVTVDDVCYSDQARDLPLTFTLTNSNLTITKYEIEWTNAIAQTYLEEVPEQAYSGVINVSIKANAPEDTYEGKLILTSSSANCRDEYPFSFRIMGEPVINLEAIAPICYSAANTTAALGYIATALPTKYDLIWDNSPATLPDVTNGNFPPNASGQLTIAVLGADADTYTGTLKLRTGTCEITETITLTIKPLVALSDIQIPAICVSETSEQKPEITFTVNTTAPNFVAPAKYDLTWTPSVAGANVTGGTFVAAGIEVTVPAGTAAGNYTLKLKVYNEGEACQQAEYDVPFVINPKPTVTLTSDVLSVCEGAATATLSFTTEHNPVSYTIDWTGGNPTTTPSTGILTAAGTIDLAVGGATPGSYPGTLVVTTAAGCESAPASFTLYVQELPEIASKDRAYCPGADVEIDLATEMSVTNIPGRVFTYSWKVTGAGNINSANSAGLMVTSGNAEVEFTAQNNGTTPITFDITVTPQVEDGTVDGEITCPGAPATLTITVNPKPQILNATLSDICYGATPPKTTLSFAGSVTADSWTIEWDNTVGATTENWTTPATGSASDEVITITENLEEGKTYKGWLTITTSNNCQSLPKEVSFKVINEPTIADIAIAGVCYSDVARTIPLTFTGDNLTHYEIEWDAGSPLTDVPPTSFSGTVIDIAVPAGLSPDNSPYGGQLRVAAGDCWSTTWYPFALKVYPTVAKVGVDPAKTTTCGKGTITLFDTGIPADVRYDWSVEQQHWQDAAAIGMPAPYSGSDLLSFTTNNPLVTIVVPVTVIPKRLENGVEVCHGESTDFTITVNPKPVINTASIDAVCAVDAETLSLQFNANVDVDSYRIEWNETTWAPSTGSAATLPITINMSANVPTTTTNNGGTLYIKTTEECESDGYPFSFTVNPTPEINTVAIAPVCASDAAQTTTLTFTATNAASGQYEIVWDNTAIFNNNNYTYKPFDASTLAIPLPALSDGNYTARLFIKTEEGCPTSETFTLNVQELPKIASKGMTPYCPNDHVSIVLGTEMPVTNITGRTFTYSWAITGAANINNAKAATGLTDAQLEGITSIAFTAQNTGTTPITFDVTVTPQVEDGTVADGEITCPGPAATLTITVNPKPWFLNPEPELSDVCLTSEKKTALSFTPSIAAATEWRIVWDNENGDPTKGWGVSLGSGSPATIDLSARTLEIDEEYSGTLYIKVDGACESDGFAVSFKVINTPEITSAEIAGVCFSEDARTIPMTVVTGNMTKYSISWDDNTHLVNVAEGAFSGSSIMIEIPAGLPSSDLPYTGTLKVAAGDCWSDGYPINLWVYPAVDKIVQAAVTECGGEDIALFDNIPANVQYEWSVAEIDWVKAGAIGVPVPYSSSGALSFRANNPVEATTIAVTVIPKRLEGGVEVCQGVPTSFTITVNPTPVITEVTFDPICNGAESININYNANVDVTSYRIVWTDVAWGTTSGTTTGSPISVDMTGKTLVAGATYSGNLYLTAAEGACESKGFGFGFTVNDIPDLTSASATPLCQKTTVQNATISFTSTSTDLTAYEISWTGENPSTTTGTITGSLTNGQTDISVAIAAGKVGPFVGTLIVKEGECKSSLRGFTLTINPTPATEDAAVAICSKAEGATITIADEMTITNAATIGSRGVSWDWEIIGDANLNNAHDAGIKTYSGTDAIEFDKQYAGATPIVFKVVVTPKLTPDGGNNLPCPGTPKVLTVTVNPQPIFLDPQPVVEDVCINDNVTMLDVVFTTNVTGSLGSCHFEWNDGAGEATAGWPVIDNMSIVGTGSPYTGKIPVTPEQWSSLQAQLAAKETEGVYELSVNGKLHIRSGVDCSGSGAEVSFKVLSRPRIVENNLAAKTVCQGKLSTTVTFTPEAGVVITGYRIESAAAWLDGQSETNLFGTQITITIPGSTPAGDYSGTIVLIADKCETTPIPLTLKINETPTVTVDTDYPFCAGDHATIEFEGNMTTDVEYRWKVVSPADYQKAYNIGLDIGGTGNIVFDAKNDIEPLAPITIAMEVTPYSMDGTIEVCSGTTQPFTVTVHPKPVITYASINNICYSSDNKVALELETNIDATSYRLVWEDAGETAGWGESTGTLSTASPYSVSIDLDDLAATVSKTIAPKTAYNWKLYVTATGCESAAYPETGWNTFNVLDRPEISGLNTPTICFSATEAKTTAITFTSADDPVRYEIVWNTPQPNPLPLARPLSSVGTAYTIPLIVGINTAPNQYQGTLKVFTAEGCESIEQSISLIVNPLPAITAKALTYCAGASANINLSVEMPITPTGNYTWMWNIEQEQRTAASILTGGVLGSSNYSGTTTIPTFTAAYNSGYSSFNIKVTPKNTDTGCEGTPQNLTITVNPTPVIQNVQATDVCVTTATPKATLTYTVADNVDVNYYKIVWTSGLTGTQSGAVTTIEPIDITLPTPLTAGTEYVGMLYVTTGDNADADCMSLGREVKFKVIDAPVLSDVEIRDLCHPGSATTTPLTIISSDNLIGSEYFIKWGSKASAVGFTDKNTTITIANVQGGDYVLNIDVPVLNDAQLNTDYTFEFYVRTGDCESEHKSITLNVFEPLVLDELKDKNVCPGNVSVPIVTTVPQDVAYKWTVHPEDILKANNIGMEYYSGKNVITFQSNYTGLTSVPVRIVVSPQRLVSGTDELLCTGEDKTFTMTMYPEPIINSIDPISVLCSTGTEQSISLSFEENVPTGYYRIEWTEGGLDNYPPIPGALAAYTQQPIKVTIPAAATAGTYKGKLFVALNVDDVALCESEGKEFTFEIAPEPTVTSNPVAAAVCTGTTSTSLTFTTDITTTQYKVVWAPTGNPSTLPDVTTWTNGVSPVTLTLPSDAKHGPYTGTLHVRTADGCEGKKTFILDINQKPTLSGVAADNVCFTGAATSTELTFTVANLTGDGEYAIVWNSTPASIANIPYTAFTASPVTLSLPATATAGWYNATLYVRKTEDCPSDGATFSFRIQSPPVISSATVTTTNICSSATAQTISLNLATTNSPDMYRIEWNPGNPTVLDPVDYTTIGAMPLAIAIPAGALAGPYTGTVYVKNSSTTCESIDGKEFFFTIGESPEVLTANAALVCHNGRDMTTPLTYTTSFTGAVQRKVVWEPTNPSALPDINWTSGSGSISLNIPAAAQRGAYTGTLYLRSASSGCEGEGKEFTLQINVKPIVRNNTTDICTGKGYEFEPTGSIVPEGTRYTWDIPTVAGIDITPPANTTDELSFNSGTLVNHTTSAIDVVYTVTPRDGGCIGNPFTVTVTVHPNPAPENKEATICSGNAYSYNPTGSGVSAKTTYTWTAPVVTGVTGMASGTNATTFNSGILVNNTNEVKEVVYTVAPKTITCEGTPFTVTVKVNPTPVVADVTDDICSNQTLTRTSSELGAPAGTTYSWETPEVNGITITPPANTTDAGAFNSGKLVNTTASAIVVTYTVTPKLGDCLGANFTVSITVDPATGWDSPQAAICSGTSYSHTPTGTIPAGTTYSWARPEKAGLTGMSEGNDETYFFSGKIFNETTAPIAVVFTVIPSTASDCGASSFTVTITVNPTVPAVSDLAASICSSEEYTNPLNTALTYSWEAPEVEGVTGMSSSEGKKISFNSGILLNTTLAPITVPFKVIPYLGTCAGKEFTIDITVNPVPDISQPSDIHICSNREVAIYAPKTPSTSGPSDTPIAPDGTRYSWEAPVSAYIDGLTAGSDAESFNSGILVNKTDVEQTVTYTITPIFAGCEGADFNIVVHVRPLPTYTAHGDVEGAICSGTEFTYVLTDDNLVPAGTKYKWDEPDPITGLTGMSESWDIWSDNFFSGTLVNATNAPIDVEYTVYPTTPTCTGDAFKVLITVNPTPAIANKATAICSGVPFSVTPVNAGSEIVPANTTYSWAAPVATGVTGLEASAPDATSVAGTLTNTTNAPVNVVYKVTATTDEGCEGKFDVTVTVNPMPSIKDKVLADATSGTAFSLKPVNGTDGDIVPANTKYSWNAPAAVTGISGLAAGANEDAFKGTLVNSTSSPISVVYVVTPISGNCPGASFKVTVTVAPGATFDNYATAICSGESVTYTPTGTIPTGTVYSWTAPTATGIEGITSGTNRTLFESGILTNTTSQAVTVTYTLQPTLQGGHQGATFTITITVNPTPDIAAKSTTICSGGQFSIAPVNGSGNDIVPVTTKYSWAAPSVPNITGTQAGTEAESVTGTLSNSSNAPIDVTYKVTAKTDKGCESKFDVTVTVNPVPAIDNAATAICSGTGYDYTPTGSIVPANVTYSWNAPDVPGVSGMISGANEGTFQSGNLINGSANAVTVVYTVTPTAGNCTGQTFTVSIKVNPAVSINPVDDKVACSGQQVAETTFSSSLADAVYHWTNDNPAIGLGVSGDGNIPAFAAADLTETAVATIRIMAESPSGCIITDETFTITVVPSPKVDEVDDVAACSGATLEDILFTGSVNSAKVVYTWTNDHPEIGLPATGTGNILSAVVTNDTDDIITATITVTAKYVDETVGKTCEGPSEQFTITVSPEIEFVNTTNAGQICSDAIFICNSISNIADATFSWTRPAVENINGGEGASGTGSKIEEALYNSTDQPIEVKYYYTASYNGCEATSEAIVVTVNPIPLVNISQLTSVCVSDIQVEIACATEYADRMLYTIHFDEKARNAGFKDITDYKRLPGEYFSFDMPATEVEPGNYQGTVTLRYSDGDCIKTHGFTFKVAQPIAIVSHPKSHLFCDVIDHTLEVEVTAGADVTYQWYHNNVPVPGATESTLHVTEAGDYYVLVTSKLCINSIRSQTASVVQNGLEIFREWNDKLFVEVNAEVVSYQWYKNDEPVRNGGNESSFVDPDGLNGIYKVGLTFADGSSQISCDTTFHVKNVNWLHVYPNPALADQPITITINMGYDSVAGSRLLITEMSGREIVNVPVTEFRNTFTTHLSSGAYVIAIINKKGKKEIYRTLIVL